MVFALADDVCIWTNNQSGLDSKDYELTKADARIFLSEIQKSKIVLA